ncbi:ROK family protein [Microbacterium trichothecenolyticum]|uniref:Glucokinase n=1 Tax=Microbacterium trichothecenolyticum TaxID=69370 RepID=A0ABU0TW44_MICTR|nr:ROK family protein [Microbacterium trichothecenolyticum]MDQ1123882.1 glucokinase [Microbacterium trichothecenolyticum]
MTLLLGVDNGGTRVKLLLARDAGGRLEHVRTADAPTPRGIGAMDELAAITRGFLGDDRADAFGITVAGIFDEASGAVVTSANMRWLEGLAPARELSDRLGIPGVVVQDGVATAIAEAVLGAGRGADDVFVLALGTGIAGAHVVDGAVRKGAHGGAGEIGHIATGRGEKCTCGQSGCLESLLGGTRLGARWDRARGVHAQSTAVDVVHGAERGDESARAVLDEATSALANGLLSVMAMIDPGVIVIGGGLSNSPEWIIDPAVDKARRQATFHAIPPIVRAELGSWAGAWGAVLAAEQRVGDALRLEHT